MVYIYILQLEQGKYYIGKTNNPQFRIDSHFNFNGSAWTTKYKPIQIIKIIPKHIIYPTTVSRRCNGECTHPINTNTRKSSSRTQENTHNNKTEETHKFQTRKKKSKKYSKKMCIPVSSLSAMRW